MSVDFTIRIGDILLAISVLGGGVWVIQGVRAELKLMSRRLGVVEDRLSQITDLMVLQAKHDVELKTVKEDIKELRRALDAFDRN